MWQSAALVGALSLGGSAPTEFGTCWASLWPTWIPEAVAVIAATQAPLMKVRRAIIFSSPLFDVDEATHSAERSEEATCEVAVAAQHRHPRLRERELSRTPRERAPACPSFLRIRPSLPRRPGTHHPALDRPAAGPTRPQARTDRSRRRNVRKPRFRAACGVTCRLRILRKRPAGAFRG